MTKTATRVDIELASRLRLVVTRLGRRLRRHVQSPLTPSQTAALSSLERLGPLTLGELSQVEGVRPPTMTKIVAALEEEGMVVRRPDGRDRRVVRVAATAAGGRLLAANRSRTDAYLAARLQALPGDDLAVLLRAVEVLERVLEAEE